MTVLLAALAAVCAAAVLMAARRMLVVVTVTGTSMEPVYRQGDRVLVLRLRTRPLRPGAVVVFACPRNSIPGWLIKRVVAVGGDDTPDLIPQSLREPVVPAGHVVVSGENPSFDSRHFGYLPVSLIRGVVLTGLAGGKASSAR
jgi:signal peptidase I